ncbi:unnamed protein product [Arabis nemorensis]|uniref:NTF2 domain-containing protein n=1 Tax=Arabis nemorensis TaxID=586526 RepID=A0A565AYZ6_9BRAS|nr:unnamed protein product [Arabis nemorensis]
MTTEAGVPSVHVIADAFVEQYYRIMGQLPQQACRFYVDASVVSRPRPDGTMMSFTSVEAIDKHFLSCDYSTTFEVVSVHSQNSFKDGILIMVIGFLTGKDKVKRNFSQTFYFARQNTSDYSLAYDVLNDIFRYIDEEETSTPITLPVVESVPAAEADELNMTEPIREIDDSVENSFNASEGKNVVDAQKPTEPVTETVAPQPDGAKREFY